MNAPDKPGTIPAATADIAPSDPAAWLRSYRLPMLAVILIAAIPRLYLGATQFIEYDGYWNAFFAQQDRWQNFVWEYRAIGHPPLYFLLLRISLWFGHWPLAYRAVSLITGLAAIYLIARIASKMMRWKASP